MNLKIVFGDLLDQSVDVIVNPWNRNLIPWWLLLPQGVSGAIKKKGGTLPFQELAKMGGIPLGEARLTHAGKLPFQAIIHVAGINLFWFATDYSVRASTRAAMVEVIKGGYQSVAFPLIGSGSGNRGKAWSKSIMIDELNKIDYDGQVILVEYKKAQS